MPFCSARFLLSRAWKESEDCISPTLPDLAKQLPSIALRDHVPSSLQASLLKTTRQATPKFSLFEFARQAQSSPTRRPPSVGQSRHAHTPSLSRPCQPQAPTSVYTSPSFSRQLVRPLRLIVFQRGLRVRTSKPDGYLQGSRSDHLRVSRSFDWRAASYPPDQALTNAHHAFQVGCGCHTRAPKPISVSCVCRGAEARNTPFRRPSCQAREEKRKFSPTATSLRRRRQRSRT